MMGIEVEAKFLDIEPGVMRRTLQSAGGEMLYGRELQRRAMFDTPDHRLDELGTWLRLRSTGDRISLALKREVGGGINGTVELEVEVGDFTTMGTILGQLGFVVKAEVDTYREAWRLRQCEVTLDEWPHIPPFIEIEGPSEQAVREATEQLSLDFSSAVFGSADVLYERYLGVPREVARRLPLRFDRRPPEPASASRLGSSRGESSFPTEL